MKQIWRPRGFTQYELGVVIVVMGIMFVVILQRTLFYQEQASRAQAQEVIDALGSAVRMQMSSLRIKGRETEITGLALENPMNQLQQKPANYVGEFYLPPAQEVSNGNWYFSRTEKKLIYNYTVTNYFKKNSQYQLSFSIKSVTINGREINRGNEDGLIDVVILDQPVP